VDVAEILMRRRIRRIEPDGFLERGARFGVLARRCVDRGEIVVRLGELRVVLGELLQERLGLARAPAVGEQHRLEESHLRVLRAGGERAVGALERRGGLPCAVQPRHLGKFLRGGRRRAGSEHAAEQQSGDENPGQHRWQTALANGRER
jgi:hypothetical protein